jgi:hypothetical protein
MPDFCLAQKMPKRPGRGWRSLLDGVVDLHELDVSYQERLANQAARARHMPLLYCPGNRGFRYVCSNHGQRCIDA